MTRYRTRRRLPTSEFVHIFYLPLSLLQRGLSRFDVDVKGRLAIMMFRARLSTVLFLVAAAATAAVAQSACPFFPGICPVTLDNTVGVSKDSRGRKPDHIMRSMTPFHVHSATGTTSTTSTRARATAIPSRPATISPCLTTRRGTRRNASTSLNAARTVPNARPVRGRARGWMGNWICQEFLCERRHGSPYFISPFPGPTTPDVGDCLPKKKTFPQRKKQLFSFESSFQRGHQRTS